MYASDFVTLMDDKEKETEKDATASRRRSCIMMWPVRRETMNLQFGERAERSN